MPRFSVSLIVAGDKEIVNKSIAFEFTLKV
jgi:hypothetical protein